MRTRFMIIVLLQILVLTGMIAYRQYWVSTEERVLLRTVPVDPRDIFRGDYVNLNYEISNLDLDSLLFSEKIRPNDTVFILLKKEPDNTYSAASLSMTMPSSWPFIRGRAGYESTASRWEVKARDEAGDLHLLSPRWFSGITTGDRVLFCIDLRSNVLSFFKTAEGHEQKCNTGTPLLAVVEEQAETRFRQLRVEYGIESYFVEEGKGREIETARNARDLKVEVSLRRDGKGIIRGLLMDSTDLSD